MRTLEWRRSITQMNYGYNMFDGLLGKQLCTIWPSPVLYSLGKQLCMIWPSPVLCLRHRQSFEL